MDRILNLSVVLFCEARMFFLLSKLNVIKHLLNLELFQEVTFMQIYILETKNVIDFHVY